MISAKIILRKILPFTQPQRYLQTKMTSSHAIRYGKDRKIAGLDYENEGKWKGPFFFVQGADPQLGLISDYLHKKPVPNWDAEIKLTNQAVDAVNALNPKPKFFIICGDLINAFPGQPGREEQEKDFKEILARVDPEIPLVCVCGNHDVGQQPTHESMEIYRKSFGDDYFSFWIAGVKCICLNTQFYADDTKVADLRAEMDKWLDEELHDLKVRSGKHVIIFQHIGLFLVHSDEDDDYFNIPKTVRKILIDKFKNAGVKFVFCGHYHRNAGGEDGELNCVVTSAIGGQLGDDKSGFRLVKVLDDVITHKYFGLEDVPNAVDVTKANF